jgi:Mor family transcriptional regulator
MRQYVKLTKEQKHEIFRRYLAGESATNLALEYGASRKTVYRIVDKIGIQRVRVIGEEKG